MATRPARRTSQVEALHPDDASHLAFMVYAIKRQIGDSASLQRIVDNLKTKKAKDIGNAILEKNANGGSSNGSKLSKR